MRSMTLTRPWWLALACSALCLWGCPQFPEGENNGTTNNGQADMGGLPDLGGEETRSCGQTVTFEGGSSAQSVSIAGEFNGWDAQATPLTRLGSAWTVELSLEPGEYAYKFVVDGVYESAVPPDVYTKWDGEFENRNLIVPDCARPTWRVGGKQVGADGTITAALKFVSGRGGEKLDPATLRVTVGDAEVQPSVDATTGAVTISYKAPAHGKYSIRAWAKDTAGRATEQDPLWLPLWHQAEPFEWQDATMYLIFTDRFRDTDGTQMQPVISDVQPIAGYMGGDFKGIIKAIEDGYFEEMGVNLLWLSPIYENTEESWVGGDGVNRFTGYHGYWPIRALDAETRYGDAEADANARLKELIDKAHARGMRVLFDVVHNHVHQDHEYCKENPSWCEITCTCGTGGCDWEGPNGKPLTCQFAPYLPDLSYRKHDLLRRQVEDTLKLVERFDVDGVRVDAAKHMDHIIMRSLRMRLNELEAQGAAPFYSVGETFTGGDGYGLIMDYVADYELHGQFDFPLLYPIRGTFGHNDSFRSLDAAVVRSEQSYGTAYPWMSPFLGNHDIERFVTNALGNSQGPWGGTPDVMAQGAPSSIDDGQWNIINRLSMAFAFLLTQPGVPLIYYGDEIGLAGGPDPDNRRMMLWDWNAGQRELLGRVRAIGQARQQLEPLRRGKRKQLWVDDDLYVYARYTAPDKVVLIAMNKGDTTRSEQITIPDDLSLGGKVFTSATSERSLTVSGTTVTVTLDPKEYGIFHSP